MNLFAILLLAELAAAPPVTTHELTSNGARLKLVEEPFFASEHTVKVCKNISLCACEIDGSFAYGTVPCGLPATRLVSITLTTGSKSYALDTSNLYDPWGGDQPKPKVWATCKDSSNCIVKGLFSDGAGTYAAEWRIEKGRAKRTVMTDEEAIGALWKEFKKQ